MTTKNKTTKSKSRVRVGKLKVNKETVKDLIPNETKQVKGGIGGRCAPSLVTSCPGRCAVE